jgi:thioredoxin-like negative regulator of GroEL
MTATSASASPIVDAEHPWLGLNAYTEATQAYFFGRDAEIREMYTRVRENPLTILYGQSGLGKSSLLGAGLIPKFKVEQFHPVLLRLDFSKAAPSLVEQTRSALCSAFRSPIPAEEGEGVQNNVQPNTPSSLWEILHNISTLPTDLREHPPILIFDQFEEIFTLSAARAAEVSEWFQQIADLVENRPPAALQERFRNDRQLARQFDSAASPARIVITLREDYLSHLEGWKNRLPSLMRNRMALHRLTGSQALEAVVNPGSRGAQPIVTAEVGAQIVRKVAQQPDDMPLESIEAVPPFLSLLCEQLNAARLKADPPLAHISPELVAQYGDDILDVYYAESFAEQALALRAFVEDRLVSGGGYRNPITREDAEIELHNVGVSNPAEALDALIARRLLAAEARGGIPWLELTHDILAPLVVRSRTARREQETLLEAERQKRRQRHIVSALAALVLLFAGLAGFGWYAYRQAEQARTEAREKSEKLSKALEKSYSANREALAGYWLTLLIDDFRDGKLDKIGVLNKVVANINSGDDGQIIKLSNLLAEYLRLKLNANDFAEKKSQFEEQYGADFGFLDFDKLYSHTIHRKPEFAIAEFEIHAADIFLFMPDDNLGYLAEFIELLINPNHPLIFDRYGKNLSEYEKSSLVLLNSLFMLARYPGNEHANNVLSNNMFYKDLNNSYDHKSLFDEIYDYHNTVRSILFINKDAKPHETPISSEDITRMFKRVGMLAGFMNQFLHSNHTTIPPEIEKKMKAFAKEGIYWLEHDSKFDKKGIITHSPAEILAQANHLFDDKKWNEAAAKFREILAIAPQDYYASLGLGRSLLNDGQHSQALTLFQVVTKSWPDEAAPWAYQIETILALNHVEEAELLVADLGSHFIGDKADLFSRIASVYFSSNQFNKAVEYANKSIQEITDNDAKRKSVQYGGLSWYFLFNRQFTEAISSAEAVLALDPSKEWVKTNLAHAYLFSGQFEKAKTIYLENKDRELGGNGQKQTFRQAVLDDFKIFREKDLTHPDVQKIEELLKQ